MHGGMRTALPWWRRRRAREHVATALTSVVWGTCCRVFSCRDPLVHDLLMISRPLDDYGRYTPLIDRHRIVES